MWVYGTIVAVVLLLSLPPCRAQAPEPEPAPATQTNFTIVRILTFGDSITEGFLPVTGGQHPYTSVLGEHLDRYLAGKARVDVSNGGIGRSALSDIMPTRMNEMLENATAAGYKYDWVIILAGINDIFRGNSAEKTWGLLQQMYANVLQHGARIVALPLMPTSMTPYDPRELERRAFNTLIRQGVTKRILQGNRDIILNDMNSRVSYYGITDAERAVLWDDGTHPSIIGYDRMGFYIFEALKPYMNF